MRYPASPTRRKIMGFLNGAISKGNETTPFEILGMLAIVLVFMLAYTWLDEIQALVGRPFG
jgi:hypothetical protein